MGTAWETEEPQPRFRRVGAAIRGHALGPRTPEIAAAGRAQLQTRVNFSFFRSSFGGFESFLSISGGIRRRNAEEKKVYRLKNGQIPGPVACRTNDGLTVSMSVRGFAEPEKPAWAANKRFKFLKLKFKFPTET